MYNRLEICKNILEKVKKTPNTIITHENSLNEWIIPNIDCGDGSFKSFIIKYDEFLGKTGKTYKKRQIFMIDESNSNKSIKIELGSYKKEYLYKIINRLSNLNKNKTKSNIKRTDLDDILNLRSIIKKNRNLLHYDDNNNLVGELPNIGTFKLTPGYIKHMKNNHNRVFGRQLFINDELYSEGWDLHLIISSFNDKRIKKD